jgi:hypothetical protein
MPGLAVHAQAGQADRPRLFAARRTSRRLKSPFSTLLPKAWAVGRGRSGVGGRACDDAWSCPQAAPLRRGPAAARRSARPRVRSSPAGNGRDSCSGTAAERPAPGFDRPPGQRSAMCPIPAYSRTAAMPATAASLSSKALETTITVPSGAVSRNLTCACASTNSSNKPAIGVLPFCGLLPGRRCRRGRVRRHPCRRTPLRR